MFRQPGGKQNAGFKTLNLGRPLAAGRCPPQLIKMVVRTRDSDHENWLDALPINTPTGIAAGIHTAGDEDWVIIELFPSTVSAEERQSRERWERLEADALVFQGLCHDLRNPLGSLRGAAQLLEHEVDGNRRREYLGEALNKSILDLAEHAKRKCDFRFSSQVTA